jgi:hypothetical protein
MRRFLRRAGHAAPSERLCMQRRAAESDKDVRRNGTELPDYLVHQAEERLVEH